MKLYVAGLDSVNAYVFDELLEETDVTVEIITSHTETLHLEENAHLILGNKIVLASSEQLIANIRDHGLKLYLLVEDINNIANILPLIPVATAIFANTQVMAQLAKCIQSAEITISAPNARVNKEDIMSALYALWDHGATNVFADDQDGGLYFRPQFSVYHTPIVNATEPAERPVKHSRLSSSSLENIFALAIFIHLSQGIAAPEAATYGQIIKALYKSGREINSAEISALKATMGSVQYNIACPQFAAISLDKTNYFIHELLIDGDQLRDFLRSRKFPADRPSDLIPQLSASGLALIASIYNARADHRCAIAIASHSEHMINVIKQMSTAPNGIKLVVVFHATDYMKAGFFRCNLHKAVIYLEKRDNTLHVLYADTIPIATLPDYMLSLVHSALSADGKYVFYQQRHLPHPKPEKGNLFLQRSLTHCGAHALRIAHKIAQCGDFLATLNCEASSDPTRITYEIPHFFAINATSETAQTEILTLFSNRPTEHAKLAANFTKHKEVPYGEHFSNKFLHTIHKVQDEEDATQISRRIAAADVRSFQPR